MNREILFRGKRCGNSEWIYGYYMKERACDGVQHIIVDEDGEYYLINLKTCGQYTGLTDKNGTKIFEGDIVEHTTFHNDDKVRTGIVVYIEEYGAFFIVGSGYSDNQLYAFCNFKVVGNVFDNPELLKEE